ncbi:MAG: hypothetical protein WAO21_02470 [Verrucomicrobiia bacterium]
MNKLILSDCQANVTRRRCPFKWRIPLPCSRGEPASRKFLKQSAWLPGYGIGYESFFIKAGPENGIQNGAAIACIFWCSDGQMRVFRCSRSCRAGSETGGSAGIFGGHEWQTIHCHPQKCAFMTCATTFQFFMQELCVQERFARRIRPEAIRQCHDRCATVRGVHAELPEHGI